MSARTGTGSENVFRLKPDHYMHILDNNQNVTRVLTGPRTYTKLDHETITLPPTPMIRIPPRHWCTISNPVVRGDDGKPLVDQLGATKVRLGDSEIRFEQLPFPLYPDEVVLNGTISPLTIIPQYEGLKLKALRPFENRVAGEVWQFLGPGTYIPRVEVQIVERIKAAVVKDGTALHLRAICDTTDATGTKRLAGESFLWRQAGTYMPSVDEELLDVVTPQILTQTKALHLEAVRGFTDALGKKRHAGEQWLLTHDEAEEYLITPDEKKLTDCNVTVIGLNQYCVVENVWKNGKLALGSQEIREGPCSFFLNPGEKIVGGIQELYVLSSSEAVLLQAKIATESPDETGKNVPRAPGDRWMIYGPRTFLPPLEVEVVEKRCNIPLAANQGIYIRDQLSGHIRTVIGETYMLKANEALWEKPLPDVVEKQLLKQGAAHSEYIEGGKGSRRSGRNKSQVVRYQLPHNTVCQVYDFKSRSQRIVFGPAMVMLGPDEEFTVLSLSGSEWVAGEPNVVRPKQPDMIKAIFLFLGPDTMSDVFNVETSDHTRLSLQLSYNWKFDVEHGDAEAAKKCFNVPDFVGDTCKAVASRVRGRVAAITFDDFHKNSANVVHAAVFGMEADGKTIRKQLRFPSNNLILTGVDIQVAECVDQRTRDSLQKSVKLAIEITIASQEAEARHKAEALEQTAKGQLERQIINDKSSCEKERKQLLELQAESATIESTGGAKAEAKANAASSSIDGKSEVEQAQLQADAAAELATVELTNLTATREANIAHQGVLNKLEIDKQREMAAIEVGKFSKAVTAIGKETIASMARAGPEMQARMLKGLGLQGYMLTDGNSPINLMNTAQSMVGNMA